MFHLLKLKDSIEIEPAYFPKSEGLDSTTSADKDVYSATFADLLWHRLSEKYVAKVIPGQGVCVGISEVLDHSFGTIRGEDGAAWSTVVFNALIACPVRGQRLVGTVSAQDEGGLYLSLEVLTVRVPRHMLMENSQFDPVRHIWYLPVEEETSVTRNYYVMGEECIVAIDSVRVRSQADMGHVERLAPIDIVGSFTAASGLGPKKWFED